MALELDVQLALLPRGGCDGHIHRAEETSEVQHLTGAGCLLCDSTQSQDDKVGSGSVQCDETHPQRAAPWCSRRLAPAATAADLHSQQPLADVVLGCC